MTSFSGLQQNKILYDPRLGRFKDLSTGKMVSRANILKLVDEEAARLATRMQGHARLLAQSKIDLPEWQRRSAEDLKLSSIRSTLLGSGGKTRTTSAQYGATGRLLREQYQFLDGFARDLADGKLSKAQAIARAASYGPSTKTAFHAAEKIAKRRENFIEAIRDLDPAAKHCSSCLRYSTNGLWIPIEQVIMPGVNCECFHYCRCRVRFRKRRNSNKTVA